MRSVFHIWNSTLIIESFFQQVDIDEKVLTVFQQRAVPLLSDYLRKREEPLRIEVLKGSITDSVEQLRNVDVVIGLEMYVFI